MPSREPRECRQALVRDTAERERVAAAQPLSAAWAASHTKETYLAARFRRLAARKGKTRASVAVAHTILVSVYHMLKNKQSYRELGADFLDRHNAENVKRYLVKRLDRLGL